jgi:heme exporter protein A
MEPSISSAIEINSLRKSYGAQFILNNINLVVNWGDFLCLFGPNGSGKTTLLKILATLYSPSGGTLRIAGVDLDENPSHIRKNIGVVTHQPLLYSHLTGYENLYLHGMLFRVPKLENRIIDVAKLLEITPFLYKRTDILSHGMQKRISLARSILHDPSILLLDEPDAGLDQSALSILDNLIESIRGRRTIIMSTHNIDLGLRLANRVAILSAGKMLYNEMNDKMDSNEFKQNYTHLTGESK